MMTPSNSKPKEYSRKTRPRGSQCSSDSTPYKSRAITQATTPPIISQVPATLRNLRNGPEYASHVVQTPSTPLWDDSNGAIYTIPDIPQRSSAGAHTGAGVARGNLSLKYARSLVCEYVDNGRSYSVTDDAVQPPVGSRAGRGEENDENTTHIGVTHRPTPLEFKTRCSSKRFISYLERRDVRNAEDLGRLARLDAEAVASTGFTAQCTTQMLEKSETVQLASISLKDAAKSQSRVAELLYGPMSPILQPARTMSRVQGQQDTAHKVQRKKPPIEKNLSPSTDKEMRKIRPEKHKRTSSATLDKVRQLRAEELKLPYMKSSDPDWSVQLHELGRTLELSAESHLRKSERNAQHASKSAAIDSDGTDDLAETAMETVIDQGRFSSQPLGVFSGLERSVPVGLDPKKIKTENIEQRQVLVEKEDKRSSTESVATSQYGEFEGVAAPLWDEREKNGGKKGWYSFRR